MAEKKMRTPPRGQVRVQFSKAGMQGGARVTIPSQLARLVGTDRLFQVELVEEGILLRYVEGGEPVKDTLPGWLLGT